MQSHEGTRSSQRIEAHFFAVLALLAGTGPNSLHFSPMACLVCWEEDPALEVEALVRMVKEM